MATGHPGEAEGDREQWPDCLVRFEIACSNCAVHDAGCESTPCLIYFVCSFQFIIIIVVVDVFFFFFGKMPTSSIAQVETKKKHREPIKQNGLICVRRQIDYVIGIYLMFCFSLWALISCVCVKWLVFMSVRFFRCPIQLVDI